MSEPRGAAARASRRTNAANAKGPPLPDYSQAQLEALASPTGGG